MYVHVWLLVIRIEYTEVIDGLSIRKYYGFSTRETMWTRMAAERRLRELGRLLGPPSLPVNQLIHTGNNRREFQKDSYS